MGIRSRHAKRRKRKPDSFNSNREWRERRRRNEHWHKCGRKIKHKSYREAERHIDGLKGISEGLEIYKCSICHGYHVGHVKGYRSANPRFAKRQNF
jgi:hypothetical protein